MSKHYFHWYSHAQNITLNFTVDSGEWQKYEIDTFLTMILIKSFITSTGVPIDQLITESSITTRVRCTFKDFWRLRKSLRNKIYHVNHMGKIGIHIHTYTYTDKHTFYFFSSICDTNVYLFWLTDRWEENSKKI